MRDARRAGAFFSGLLLYCAVIGCAFVLAGLHLPRALAGQLGGVNSLAVLVVEAALVAAAMFVLALPWAYVSVKPRGRGRRMLTAWFASGIGLAWLGGLLVGVFNFALESHGYQISLAQLLLASDTPPLWGLLNIAAVVLAMLLAHALARRFNPAPVLSPPHARGKARLDPQTA